MDGRLSTVLMEASAERWLQLAEMGLDGEESKVPCSGEMEKSGCGCEETPPGLLRMLITCDHSGENTVSHRRCSHHTQSMFQTYSHEISSITKIFHRPIVFC